MLILPQKFEMMCTPSNKKHLESKGYTWKYKEKVQVSVLDLKETSQIRVDLLCDYCLEKEIKTITSTPYNLHVKNKNNNLKDSCVNCQGLKHKDVMQSKYGVSNPAYLPHVKEIQKEVRNKRKPKIENIKMDFGKRGYLLVSKEYVKNDIDLEYICLKHEDKGVQTITYANFQEKHGCYYCGVEKRTENQTGEKSHFWKGGITPLSTFMRDKLVKWKQDSLEFYKYKCVISGTQSNNLEVHHIFSFSNLLKDTLNELNLNTYYEISNYSDYELKLIEEYLINKHYEYGLGVPITPSIHKEFHRIYGKGNNNLEQFEEFKNNYIDNKI